MSSEAMRTRSGCCVQHNPWCQDLYESEGSLSYIVTGKNKTMLVKRARTESWGVARKGKSEIRL